MDGPLTEGDRVQVSGGPLDGECGTVERVRGELLWVRLDSGRSVRLGRSDVEPAAADPWWEDWA